MAPYSRGVARRRSLASVRGGCMTGTLSRSNLLETSQDFRAVEELMGYKDVSTN